MGLLSALHGRELNVEQAVVEERFKTLRDVLCTFKRKREVQHSLENKDRKYLSR